MHLLVVLSSIACAYSKATNICGAAIGDGGAAAASRRAVFQSAVAALALSGAPTTAGARVDEWNQAPPTTTGAVVVTDRNFQPVTQKSWLKSATGEPGLVIGLGGEPYFLLATEDGEAIMPYALRAECTHLGCLVQPNPFGDGFSCPCHGSQYSANGAVTRGPAPKSLGLATVVAREDDGVLVMSEYEEKDWRQG